MWLSKRPSFNHPEPCFNHPEPFSLWLSGHLGSAHDNGAKGIQCCARHLRKYPKYTTKIKHYLDKSKCATLTDALIRCRLDFQTAKFGRSSQVKCTYTSTGPKCNCKIDVMYHDKWPHWPSAGLLALVTSTLTDDVQSVSPSVQNLVQRLRTIVYVP